VWLNETPEAKCLWLYILGTKDKRGFIDTTAIGLAHGANIPLDVTLLALERFSNPDPGSRTEDFEGRRLRKIKGGWEVLNHRQYDIRFGETPEQLAKAREEKRVAAAERKRAERLRKKEAQATAELSQNRPQSSQSVTNVTPDESVTKSVTGSNEINELTSMSHVSHEKCTNINLNLREEKESTYVHPDVKTVQKKPLKTSEKQHQLPFSSRPTSGSVSQASEKLNGSGKIILTEFQIRVKETIKNLWVDWPKNPAAKENLKTATEAALSHLTSEDTLKTFQVLAPKYINSLTGDKILKMESFMLQMLSGEKSVIALAPDDFDFDNPMQYTLPEEKTVAVENKLSTAEIMKAAIEQD
jgi:hypothetical protein